MSVIQRRLSLLVGLVLVIGAVLAPSALAYPAPGEFEVVDTETGEPCSQVTSYTGVAAGGCVVPMTSVEPMRDVFLTKSPIEFDLHFTDDGWAYASDIDTSKWSPGGAGWSAGPAWWAPGETIPGLNSWVGWIEQGGIGGAARLILMANFNTPGSPGYFREQWVLDVGHGSEMGGIYLWNELQKPAKSEGWWTEPGNYRIYTKGRWESAESVTFFLK
jgi:hypothetical protein